VEPVSPQGRLVVSAKALVVFGLGLIVALPFVGAIVVTDELVSGHLDSEVVESQE